MGLLIIYDKSIICASYLQHETYWNIMQPLSLLCGPFSHFPLLFQPMLNMLRHFGAWTSESPWSLPPSGRTKLRNWHKTGLLVTTTLGWWDVYKLLMLTLWWNVFFVKLSSVVVDVVAGDLLWGSTRYKVKSCEWTFNETNEIHLSRHVEATAHKKDRACAARLHFSAVRCLDDSQAAKAPAKLPWRVLILRPIQHVC